MSDIKVAEYEDNEKVWYEVDDEWVDTSDHDKKIRADERAKVVDEMKDLIMDTPCKMVINEQDFFSDYELSMMLKKIKEKK